MCDHRAVVHASGGRQADSVFERRPSVRSTAPPCPQPLFMLLLSGVWRPSSRVPFPASACLVATAGALQDGPPELSNENGAVRSRATLALSATPAAAAADAAPSRIWSSPCCRICISAASLYKLPAAHSLSLVTTEQGGAIHSPCADCMPGLLSAVHAKPKLRTCCQHKTEHGK